MFWVVEYVRITGLMNAIMALGFGLLVISKNWRSKVNQVFFLMTLTITFWSIGIWQLHSTTDYNTAFFWSTELNIFAFLIPVFFFHFILLLTKEEKMKLNKILLLSSYCFSLLIILFIRSPLVIKGIALVLGSVFWPVASLGYTIYFFVIYVGLSSYSIYILLKSLLREKNKTKRGQFLFVLLGTVVGFGGGLTDFPLSFGIPILPYGNGLVAVFPFLLSYSMIKHHLFNAKSIATEILVFFIITVLLAQTVLSTSVTEFILRLAFLLIVGFLGYLLIKSSYSLANLNQNLEEKVEQQAGEIRKAYEVEKKARIELEKLNEEKDRFLLATQHNLRTPLTVIKGYIDVALAREKDPESRRDLEQATEAGKKMTNLLNNVLEITEARISEK